MSAWIIYDKNGLAKCEARKLEYNGEFLGACSVNVSVTSPAPIGFELGDWLEYRGERFELNYNPSVVKESSSDTYGEGFKYENVKFNSLSDELTRCDFLDYVSKDSDLHYSSLPNFSFFADSVQKLAERIQVNLDRIYTGDKQWTVNVNTEKKGKTDVNVVINNQTCWDALALVKSEFGLNFIIRGRTITIGTEGIAVGKVFSYGKGSGLTSVERNAESDQKVITRLRAYGSTKNMPESYYKNVGLQVFGEVIQNKLGDPVYLNIPYSDTLFTKDAAIGKMVRVKIGEVETLASVTKHAEKDEFEGCCELHIPSSDLQSVVYEGMKIYFIVYVNKNEFPKANKEYAENMPRNMAVRHLMLPSFPVEKTDPYIDSDNVEALGIREATIFFDGSNGNEEIYPSIEGMTADDLKAAGVECAADGALDEVVSAEQIGDDGFFKEGSTIETFKITLKDIGFDINNHLSVSGNATIAFNTGMCGGRDFEIVKCKREGVNYVLTCNRHYDESLELYFPYKDYQIKGGDKFVLVNIEMPDVYVQAASQRLLQAATKYLSSNDYVRYSYTLAIDKLFMARQHKDALINGEVSYYQILREGELLRFVDGDLGIDGQIIIDTLTIKEDLEKSPIPEFEISLRNEKGVTLIEKIQNKINSSISSDSFKNIQDSLNRDIQKLREEIQKNGQASSSGALLQDIISNAPAVGHVKTGTKFSKGMTLEDIFRRIFIEQVEATLSSSISTGTEVEYGTTKGYITYTATLNDNEAITEAYFDDVKTNKLSFSAPDGNRKQIATRVLSGTYTATETYKATAVFGASKDGKTPSVTRNDFITVNVKRKWFAGVVEKIPSTSDEVRSLGGGMYHGSGTYSFSVSKWKTIVICIPTGNINEITVTKYPGNFIEDEVCSGPATISVKGANNSAAINYKMWVIQSETENDEDTFTFKTI